MMPTMTTEEQAPLEAILILQLIGFSTGAMGCIFLPIAVHHSDWRLWFISESSHYLAGIARMGLWKICFPPNASKPDGYLLHCCHDFELFEKFFPAEMKLAQILLFISSLLAFWGLLFAFLVPWVFLQKRIQTRWVTFIGGTFFVLSGICVFVPLTWNVYSVFKNESINFPSCFKLPSKPTSQKNGGAVYLGYMAGILLLVSGFSILFQVSLTTKKPDIFRSPRISSE